jgi:hypothetical protein
MELRFTQQNAATFWSSVAVSNGFAVGGNNLKNFGQSAMPLVIAAANCAEIYFLRENIQGQFTIRDINGGAAAEVMILHRTKN